MTKEGKRRIEHEESSGNVYADLGLEDASELNARAKLGYAVYQILKASKMNQSEIAERLGIRQPDVSNLMNEKFSKFSTDKYLNFLHKLERKVKIEISEHKEGEHYEEVFAR